MKTKFFIWSIYFTTKIMCEILFIVFIKTHDEKIKRLLCEFIFLKEELDQLKLKK